MASETPVALGPTGLPVNMMVFGMPQTPGVLTKQELGVWCSSALTWCCRRKP
jgi:hypothetical protein